MQGMTIGIEDVTPSETLMIKKKQVVETGYRDCDDFIAQYKLGQMSSLPGCDLEQTLESHIKSRLNSLRDDASRACMATLHWDNKPLTMALCKVPLAPLWVAADGITVERI